ncbi:MAG: transcriptional regulator, partial [Aliifodinibius sp.]|nr:transcriptional regulator [candidate division Zixibacteria bacterium]NIT59280.1 transcriptional regulator [Fodinibius sp.]NIW46801.1 transcriptional regulator [Gammaproteobacteria bacterium]NIR65709.1 transcriptional regulator [candidate division Zixibacteria bacterium]NIS47393.1 transcriptional regulator [candidate division Zixibacteria bacterium]
LLARRVDGIIIVGGQITEERLQKISKDTPLVVVARKVPSLIDHCLYVDNYQGAYRATKFLLDMGHRDIAHITAQVVYQDAIDDISDRYTAYQQALRDVGIEPDPDLV